MAKFRFGTLATPARGVKADLIANGATRRAPPARTFARPLFNPPEVQGSYALVAIRRSLVGASVGVVSDLSDRQSEPRSDQRQLKLRAAQPLQTPETLVPVCDNIRQFNMKTYAIAAIPGDGIGTEVVAAGLEALDAIARRDGGFTYKVDHFDWGGEYYKKHGRMMPANGSDQIRQRVAIPFGSAGHPEIPDHITL